MRLLRRVALAVAGSVLVVAGAALLVLPGPGLLLLFAGLAVLATVFPGLQRFVEPVRYRAMKAASDSVSSPWRLAASAAFGAGLIGVGLVWGLVDGLPFGGWAAGASLVFSGLVLLGLLVYSLRTAAATARARPRVVVHPPTAPTGQRPCRRIEIDGESVGNAYAAADVAEFLRRAGLDGALIGDPAVVEWRGGGPGTWA